MSTDTTSLRSICSKRACLVFDLTVCALLLAGAAAILTSEPRTSEQRARDHVHTVTSAAGSLQHAATLMRAERLANETTIERNFGAPRTGALRVAPQPIAVDHCAKMWNEMVPDGPAASTGSDQPFSVEPTDERGICLYRYTEEGEAPYLIAYHPESGQVDYNL